MYASRGIANYISDVDEDVDVDEDDNNDNDGDDVDEDVDDDHSEVERSDKFEKVEVPMELYVSHDAECYIASICIVLTYLFYY